MVHGNSTLVSAAAAAAAADLSAADSGIDVNTSAGSSFDRDDVERRRPPAAASGRARTPDAPLTARQLERPEPEAERKWDRKSRSQSPAAMWRSFSASSLMRSLSRRRRRATAKTAASPAADDLDTATSRSKLSSFDTDSDCENRDDEARQRQRRRVHSGGSLSGSGGSLADAAGDARRRRCETVSGGGGGPRRQRSAGIFGGGRRTQTGAFAEDYAVEGQSATLPRPRRCNDGERAGSRLSSRAASWASLRRSQTAETLSLPKTLQSSQLSNGFNLVTASYTFTLRPCMVERGVVMRMSVGLSVCLSFREHISGTICSRFVKFLRILRVILTPMCFLSFPFYC